jgi:predicted CopG family antitoxin
LIGDFNGRTSVEKYYFLFDEKDERNTFSDLIENT